MPQIEEIDPFDIANDELDAAKKKLGTIESVFLGGWEKKASKKKSRGCACRWVVAVRC